MTTSEISDQTSPDSTKIGGWLFRHRTSLPVPFALVLLVLQVGISQFSWALVGTGVALTAAGEAVRLWAVHHIGVISRTRSDRLGPLISTGPFGIVRNPLYIGNVLLWIGFALTARLVWMAPVVLVLLGLEYHAIVRWEEQLLESRLGDAYRAYTSRVPRWIPRFNRGPHDARRENGSSAISATSAVPSFSWSETLFSERGTLIAIAAGYVLLWVKSLILTSTMVRF